MNLFANLQNCVYTPDADVPDRTDPDFDAKFKAYEDEESSLVAKFKVDLFTHFGVTDNAKAGMAFKVAYGQTKNLGLYAVMNLFEELLPLIVELH